jgi:predicted MFS family arabinose efflux permease
MEPNPYESPKEAIHQTAEDVARRSRTKDRALLLVCGASATALAVTVGMAANAIFGFRGEHAAVWAVAIIAAACMFILLPERQKASPMP